MNYSAVRRRVISNIAVNMELRLQKVLMSSFNNWYRRMMLCQEFSYFITVRQETPK
jgi:hypothetical protein